MEEKRMDYLHEIVAILNTNQSSIKLLDALDEYHPYDVSRAFLELEDDQFQEVVITLSNDFFSEIFEYFSVSEFKTILPFFELSRLAKIFVLMDLDEVVDLIIGLKKTGNEILKLIEPKKRAQIKAAMAYTTDEIGAYLNDSYLAIDIESSVKDTMKYVTQNAYDTDYISIVYVIQNQELMGYIRLKELITARANEKIKDIMEVRFPQVFVNDDVESVAKMMQETKESSIPIVDQSNHLIGVVTHDDLLEIISDIEEEDYTKFAGLSEFDEDIETLSIKQSVKSRLPWLSILLVLSLVTSFILSIFDARLSSSGPLLAARLAVFLPLILDMAGNTGTQSLAVTIRYISKNDQLENKIIKQMIQREFKTGLIQGLLIGFVVLLMILTTSYLPHQSLERLDYIYALVTSVSILIALIVSTTLGGLIPMILHRFKIDPAVASGPFITTVSDIITLCIYYAIGMSILLPYYS